mmetsp:Transcript_8790/g.13500  ORF Transcript_8790/g.13500 Transcript_8790/m.13500 type:complete len:196 (-) Transcript_8790:81-668(-)
MLLNARKLTRTALSLGVSGAPFSVHATRNIHYHICSKDDTGDKRVIAQRYHTTVERQSASLILGGLGIAAVAYGGKTAVKVYSNWQEQKAKQEKENPKPSSGQQHQQQGPTSEASSSFSSFFSFGKKYYDGGFEETMDRREAALVLGVRQSASVQRIKDAHRRILILNHPDRGGSPYIAAKINQAKELLMKGKEE